MITTSLTIATDLIAVRHNGADAHALLARCNEWLVGREAEEWRIRDGRCRVSQQLDLLDKAADRVRAVRINCCQIITRRIAA